VASTRWLVRLVFSSFLSFFSFFFSFFSEESDPHSSGHTWSRFPGMRTLMKITVPVEAGNRAVVDGTLPTTMKEMVERLDPEAVYFTPRNGERTAFVVFDLADPSDIPTITEPLFQRLHARVEFAPVMNLEDLQAGLSQAKE
jgi:hypothetical protein